MRPLRHAALTAVFAIALFLLQPSQVAADTFVSGALSANTTWTLAQSPIVVTGTVQVPVGITLTIQPGVVVRFEADRGILIYGALVARGTPTAKVRLTSTEAQVSRGFWAGIEFTNSSTDAIFDSSGSWIGGSVLEHVIFEGAGSGSLGYLTTIYVRDAKPLIDSVLIQKGGIGAEIQIYLDTHTSTPLRVRNSELIGSPTESGSGLSLSYRGNVAIENNVIHGYRSTAIGLAQLDPGEPYSTPPPPSAIADVVVSGNRVFGNGGVGVYHSTGAGARFQLLDNLLYDNHVGFMLSNGWSANTITMTGNVVRNNRGRGASFSNGSIIPSTVTVTHNIFADNAGDNVPWDSGWGAGLSLITRGTTTVSNNVFASNADSNMTGGGGAAYISIDGGSLLFSQNAVVENVATRAGGIQIYTFRTTTVTAVDNTVTRNISRETTDTAAIRPASIAIDMTYGTGGTMALHGNNILDNPTQLSLNRYSLHTNARNVPPVDATGNWWGTNDPTLIQTLVSPGPNELTGGRSAVDASAPLPGANTSAPISPPTGLLVVTTENDATVSWNANPETDVAGYRVWYGTRGDATYGGAGAAQGPSPIDVGPVTNFQLTGLPANAVVTVTAYDTQHDGVRDQTEGHESWFAPIAPQPLALTSLTANRPAPQQASNGATILTAVATGGRAPYRYKWQVWNGTAWSAGTWSNYNYYAFGPIVPNDNYRVRVSVQSISTLTDEPDNPQSIGIIDYPILPAPLALFLTGSPYSPRIVGTLITFTAYATGGTTNYQYKWRLSTDGGTTYSTVQDWSASETFVWTPTSLVADARISVWLRDSGTGDAPQLQETMPFVIAGPLALTSLTSNLASPQAPGSTITFTANAYGGTPLYQYKWYVYDGTNWLMVKDWALGNTFAWTPITASPAYRVAVWIRDGGSTADMYANANSNGSVGYVIATPPPPLSVTSLTSNAASPQGFGTTITFAATVAGGTAPQQYKWRVSTDGGTTYSNAQDWSTASTFAWTPTSILPNARITVWVRNTGVIADAPQAQATLPYVITAPVLPLVLSSITSNVAAPQAPGTTITFTANASEGSAPYQYKWWVFDGAWRVVQEWTPSNTFAWTPSSVSAAYRVAAWVRNAGSTADAYANANSNLSIGYEIATVVAPLSITSLTANVASPQTAGTTITFSATAAGGGPPYQYKWRVSTDGGTNFTTAQDWSTGSTFAWTPGSAIADARVTVWARNSGVAADAPQSQSTMAYVIAAAPPSTGPLVLNSITSSVPAPQAPGATITFTANASNGTAPYQYKWWVFNGTSWTVVRDWATGATYAWTPTSASAAYRVAAWVRNAGSTADVYANANSNLSIGYEIATAGVPLSVTSLTANMASPQAAGTTITFSATAAGGTSPYQYKWRVSIDGGASFTTAQDWSAGSTLAWMPGSAIADARITVWARNNGVVADAPQSQATLAYVISAAAPSTGPLILNSITSDVASPQAPGATITFTANASNGTAPYQYKWWVFNGTSWTVVRDWTASSTYAWTPSVASPAYRVAAWVRNAGSAADMYANSNANLSIGYEIATAGVPLSLTSLTANSASPQTAGTTIMFSAAAAGGTAPYQFKWRVSTDGGTSYTTAQDWSGASSLAWTPGNAIADARVSVWARNSGVMVDAPQAQSTMPYVISAAAPSTGPLVLNSITPNLASPQPPGATITFTANASGGTAPYQYKWWLFNGTSWVVVRDWATGNTYATTQTVASAAYRIGVWVRNAGSTADVYANANANASIGFVIGP